MNWLDQPNQIVIGEDFEHLNLVTNPYEKQIL